MTEVAIEILPRCADRLGSPSSSSPVMTDAVDFHRGLWRSRFRLGVVVPSPPAGAVGVGVVEVEELSQLVTHIADSVPVVVALIGVRDRAVVAGVA